MEKSKVEITVRNQSYTIITDDAPEKVIALANGLNRLLLVYRLDRLINGLNRLNGLSCTC